MIQKEITVICTTEEWEQASLALLLWVSVINDDPFSEKTVRLLRSAEQKINTALILAHTPGDGNAVSSGEAPLPQLRLIKEMEG